MINMKYLALIPLLFLFQSCEETSVKESKIRSSFMITEANLRKYNREERGKFIDFTFNEKLKGGHGVIGKISFLNTDNENIKCEFWISGDRLIPKNTESMNLFVYCDGTHRNHDRWSEIDKKINIETLREMTIDYIYIGSRSPSDINRDDYAWVQYHRKYQ
ncbi:MAG: hypothetical protein CME70_03390 [Halobacteriovorax sp.]|nr:hypothetical protein [Halobacteriovorax sp.]MBK23028.1 hypothetical protein [Halobacteriovorax sp.]|tara:strand:- start:50770 stop:51252 length:483 start_codon:yes stop_codon:yes gene_type:complete